MSTNNELGFGSTNLDDRTPPLPLGAHRVVLDSIEYHESKVGAAPGLLVTCRILDPVSGEPSIETYGWRINQNTQVHLRAYFARDVGRLICAASGRSPDGEEAAALAARPDFGRICSRFYTRRLEVGRVILVSATEGKKTNPKTGRPYTDTRVTGAEGTPIPLDVLVSESAVAPAPSAPAPTAPAPTTDKRARALAAGWLEAAPGWYYRPGDRECTALDAIAV